MTPTVVQSAALVIVLFGSVWLVLVAWLMWNRPDHCLRWLSLMGSTWKINATELGLRAVVGAALVVRSPLSRAPDHVHLFGWFVFVTSIILLTIPRRWHAAYAIWWSERISAQVVRLLAPVTAILGVLLAFVAI